MAVNNITKSQATVYTLPYDPKVFDPIVEDYKNGAKDPFMNVNALRYVNDRLDDVKLDRGDIVDIPNPDVGWSWSARWIWDGKQFLSFKDGERDRIPAEFKVITEFPIHYWYKTKLVGQWWDCSNVNFDPRPFASQIAKSIDEDGIAKIQHNNIEYTVVLDTSVGNVIHDQSDAREAVKKALVASDDNHRRFSVTWSTRPSFSIDNSKMRALVSDHTIFGTFWKNV